MQPLSQDAVMEHVRKLRDECNDPMYHSLLGKGFTVDTMTVPFSISRACPGKTACVFPADRANGIPELRGIVARNGHPSLVQVVYSDVTAWCAAAEAALNRGWQNTEPIVREPLPIDREAVAELKDASPPDLVASIRTNTRCYRDMADDAVGFCLEHDLVSPPVVTLKVPRKCTGKSAVVGKGFAEYGVPQLYGRLIYWGVDANNPSLAEVDVVDLIRYCDALDALADALGAATSGGDTR